MTTTTMTIAATTAISCRRAVPRLGAESTSVSIHCMCMWFHVLSALRAARWGRGCRHLHPTHPAPTWSGLPQHHVQPIRAQEAAPLVGPRCGGGPPPLVHQPGHAQPHTMPAAAATLDASALPWPQAGDAAASEHAGERCGATLVRPTTSASCCRRRHRGLCRRRPN